MTFAMLFLCSACSDAATSPAALLSAMAEEGKFPAGRLYDSEASDFEEHYMPSGMGETLYAIRGYDELSHVERYAVYLGSGLDTVFEAAVFDCKDLPSVSEVSEMCRVRAAYLIETGRITDGEYAIYARGDHLFFVVGMERAMAEKFCKSVR